MRKHSPSLYLLLGLLISICAAIPARAASVAQWRQDIDAVVNHVRSTHPDPFFKTGRLTFLRAAEAIKNDLPSLSEEQRMVRVMQLIASLGDGHSDLEPYRNPLFSWWYPIRLYEFSDGYFVTSAHRSVAELAGAEILEVGGRPVGEAASSARSLSGGDNDFHNKERLDHFSNAGLMKGLGYAQDDRSLQIKVRLHSGAVVTRNLTPQQSPEIDSTTAWRYRTEVSGPPFDEPQQWVSAYQGLSADAFLAVDESRPPHLAFRGPFNALALPDGDAYYIQVNVVTNTDEESLVSFFQRALGEVEAQRPKHLVLDLRYNFGGDGSNVPRVVAEFLARRTDQPWDNLYVLTGRRTFSAAVLWVGGFLQYVVPLTLIGEPPGAPLNTFGDTNSFYFDDTEFRVFISYERHEQDKSTNIDEYIPIDVPAQFSFSDYAAGRDPALDPILAGDEMRAIPVIAFVSGAEAARRAYQERQKRFSNIPWWRQPTEISLREVTRTLRDNGELKQAISVAELNTEINPNEWRTWYNLGNMQIADGDTKGALENYQRCLALNDPTNFNANYLARRVGELEVELSEE
jgi:hypothetical protein